ncbi:RpiB/LacA/LacB family sugar-phosphate isomerase [Patescibacteria group bacterium]|nr:RpiB/LacA/LacB family sugar-phosphate isomerase [Patescibacteria group bacterium]
MIIYIGADHRGFQLKEAIKEYVKNLGYQVSDLGNSAYDENDDYPGFSAAVAEKVSADPTGSRGIVICGSGVGVDVVANKFRGVRSALAFSTDQAGASRADDDTNVLALPADFLDLDTSKKIVSIWLQTPISTDPRYKRRLEEVRALEQKLKNQ